MANTLLSIDASTLPIGPIPINKYVIEFMTGANSGSFRMIRAVENHVATWNNALSSIPLAGDTFILHINDPTQLDVQQNGVFQFDSRQYYMKGQRAFYNGQLYRSLTDFNQSNAPSLPDWLNVNRKRSPLYAQFAVDLASVSGLTLTVRGGRIYEAASGTFKTIGDCGLTFTPNTTTYVLLDLFTYKYLLSSTVQPHTLCICRVLALDSGIVWLYQYEAAALMYKGEREVRNIVKTTLTAPSALSSRIMFSTTYVAPYIYVFGGVTNPSNGSYFNELWRFNPSDMEWMQLSPSGTLPAARAVLQAMVPYKGYLYVFGGASGINTYLPATTYAEVWRYDIAANSWSQVSTTGQSSARQWGGCFRIGSKVYCLQGINGSIRYPEIWAFDLLTNIWAQVITTVSLLATARPVVWCVSGKIYTFSGSNESLNLYVYDPSANTVTQLASAPQWGVDSWSFSSMNRYLHVLYGQNSTTFHLRYDINLDKWDTLPINAPSDAVYWDVVGQRVGNTIWGLGGAYEYATPPPEFRMKLLGR